MVVTIATTTFMMSVVYVCMCDHVYVCMRTHANACVCGCAYMCVCGRVCVYVIVYLYVGVRISNDSPICMYVNLNACTYVHVFKSVHM